MNRLLVAGAAFLSMITAAASAYAADAEVRYRSTHRAKTVVQEDVLQLRDCPDYYSCRPLYGAYGPYGGRAYWTGYTAGVWQSPYYWQR